MPHKYIYRCVIAVQQLVFFIPDACYGDTAQDALFRTQSYNLKPQAMQFPWHLLILTILMASAAHLYQTRGKLATMNLHHFRKVQKFACKQPQPRLIPVEDLFNVNSKDLYTPRATVLHRCGEDTGCCPREGMTCVAHNTENVTLIFNVYDTQYHNRSRQEQQASNHTLCQCVEFQ